MKLKFSSLTLHRLLTLALMLCVAFPASAQSPTFAPPADFGTSPVPYYIQIADLDGDGNKDVITGSLWNDPRAGVNILWGNGDGTLVQTAPDASTLQTGAGAYGIKVADLNGDGRLDIAVSHAYPWSDTSITILINTPSPTSGEKPHFVAKPYTLITATSAGPAGLEVADFNGDGRIDIITNSYYNSPSNTAGLVCVYLQDSNGEFGDGTTNPSRHSGLDSYAGNNVEFLAIGDFNEDGVMDAVVANNRTNAATTILRGNGNGHFSVAYQYGGNDEVGGVDVGDINGDGHLDILQMSYGSGYATIYLGNGTGAFTASSFYVGGNPINPAIRDVNGDHIQDLLMPNNGYITLCLGTGGGNFSTPQFFAMNGGSNSISAEDMNNDGKYDIVTANGGGTGVPGYSGTVSVFLNTTATYTSYLTLANVTGLVGQYKTLSTRLRTTGTNLPIVGRTVLFKLDGISIGTGTTNTNGIATLRFQLPESLGSHTLTTEFTGDASYAPATKSATLTINFADTYITVTDKTMPAGDTTNLAAVLKRVGDGAIEGKTLLFKVDGVGVGTGITNSAGRAIVSYTAPLEVGSKTITVEYVGDDYYSASVGEGVLTLIKANTVISVVNRSGRVGRTTSITARLRRVSDGAYLVGASVTLRVNGEVVGTVLTDSNGYATVLNYPLTVVGVFTIEADYAGSDTENASTDTGTLTVNP